MALEKFKASPLPTPPDEYDRLFIQQMMRVIEIYFGQLDSKTPNYAESYRADNFYGGLFSGDGYGVRLPHIGASDSTDQIAGGNDTPTVVNWNTLDSGYGFTLNPPGSATPDYPGVYKITYSLQFINTSNAQQEVTVWLKENTIDVPNSTTIFTVPGRKSATIFGYTAAYSEVTFLAQAGDDIELYWATTLAGDPTVPTDGVYMFHDAAQTTPFPRPAVPSAIGSITFVSALP
jgi:hypothetical protein